MAKRKFYISARRIRQIIRDIDAEWKGDLELSNTNYCAVTAALGDVRDRVNEAIGEFIKEHRDKDGKQGACDCDKCNAGSGCDCVVR